MNMVDLNNMQYKSKPKITQWRSIDKGTRGWGRGQKPTIKLLSIALSSLLIHLKSNTLNQNIIQLLPPYVLFQPMKKQHDTEVVQH